MGKKGEQKPISKAKKIYNIVSTVIVAAIFVFLVVTVSLMLWQRKSGADSSLFGYYMFDVLTDSMSGTIEPGEVILSKKCDPNTLEKGDIITFIAPSGQLAGYNVTHRIYDVKRDDDGNVEYFTTKGDNPNVKVDEWRLSPESVKAKFVRKSSFIGGLRGFLSHWYGYVLLIALPLCVVAIVFIVGYVRDKVEYEMEKQKLQKSDEKLTLDEMSEEQKQKLLNEFLSSRKQDSENSEGNMVDSLTSTDNDCGAENIDAERGDRNE